MSFLCQWVCSLSPFAPYYKQWYTYILEHSLCICFAKVGIRSITQLPGYRVYLVSIFIVKLITQ